MGDPAEMTLERNVPPSVPNIPFFTIQLSADHEIITKKAASSQMEGCIM
jgi:hypothetical protein